MYFLFSETGIDFVPDFGLDIEKMIQIHAEDFPECIYFEADLCAPVDHGVPFDLKREMLAQLVAADRSGIVDAEPVQMDYDTANNMLSVLQRETDLLEVAPISTLMDGLRKV